MRTVTVFKSDLIVCTSTVAYSCNTVCRSLRKWHICVCLIEHMSINRRGGGKTLHLFACVSPVRLPSNRFAWLSIGHQSSCLQKYHCMTKCHKGHLVQAHSKDTCRDTCSRDTQSRAEPTRLVMDRHVRTSGGELTCTAGSVGRVFQPFCKCYQAKGKS